MSHPFLHPSSSRLIQRVAHAFNSKDAYFVVDRNLLFVCGGPVDVTGDSIRKKFLQYAHDELPNFRVFLSEYAIQDISQYNAPDFINLVQFEDFLAEFADCILLFPESPGSFAEVGFFSAYDRVLKKLLVANKLSEQVSDSFINNGPLSLVNIHSDFRPVIHIDQKTSVIDFSPIKHRLRRFPKHNRSRFTFAPYDELEPRARLAVILEVVKLFGPISLTSIQYVISRIFNDTNLEQLTHLVSLTLAVGYLRRVGIVGDHFSLTAGTDTFFVLDDAEMKQIRFSVLDFYRRQFPDVYGIEGNV